MTPRSDGGSSSVVGDMAAVSRLFQEHRLKLLAMVQRRIDPGLAVRLDPEDVLGEAFLDACRKWPAFDPAKITPYAWLYGIVRDRLIEEWRRATRACRDLAQAMPLPAATSIQLGLGLVGSVTNPADAAAREEERARVRQVVELLAEPDREILLMRHFDELAYAEIASVLAISVASAEKRYQRALLRLAGLWRQFNPSPG